MPISFDYASISAADCAHGDVEHMTSHVVACLPPELLTRLRQAVASRASIAVADEWEQLEETWLRAPAGVLVIDPRMAPPDVRPVWALGVPTVLYTALTPEAIRIALAMCATLQCTVSIAFRGHDDTPPQLRHLVDVALLAGTSERLAHHLAPRLRTLPARGEAALLDALRNPERYRTVESLAHHAGVAPQRLRRWTREAGMISPKRLLLVGRVVWAYHYLHNRTATLRAIATRLGYAEPRDLARHVRRATGWLPRDLAHVDEPELLAQLRRYLEEPLTDERAAEVHERV
jgi:AraC-like DNA-binding protein